MSDVGILYRTHVLPSTSTLAPFPSMTTSIVVPIFSNSAASTLGRVIPKVPGAMRVVEVFVTSMGDCCLLIEQFPFSGRRVAHLVLDRH